MNKPKIIAFTGLPYVGKSTCREQLESLLDELGIGYQFVHFGSTEEVERLNAANGWGPEQRDFTFQEKERFIREQWRAEGGIGVMAVKMIPTIDAALDKNQLVIIDNMYSDEERDEIHKKYGSENLLVIAVVADWNVRVARAASREYRSLNEEELRLRDHTEIYNLHKAPTIAIAHHTILNNDSTIDAIKKDIEKRILRSII
jgi:dephospho-CoA kinase